MTRSALAFACILSAFFVMLVALTSATTPAFPPGEGPATLHIPLKAQIADNLCWAACTEMMSIYYNKLTGGKAQVIRQCELAQFISDSIPICNCDTITTANMPSNYNQGSEPFAHPPTSNCLGYTASYYTQNNGIMPWDTLCQYISRKTPVSFGWTWEGITIRAVDSSGAHFMVAEGVPHSSYISHGWISVNDPWPTGQGKHRVMAYSEYANQFPTSIPGSHTCVYNSHYGDYFVTSY